jgi:hypothetical protein
MEKIVHQSKFAIAKYDTVKELYTLTYLPETVNMRDVEWKDLMEQLLVVTDNLKPKYILDDNSDRLYAYPPEIQQWTLQLFIETWTKNGLKKYVQVLPKDFIGTLSAEQIVELANISFSEIFQNTFVSSYEEAVKWLDIQI